jgi:hypothetical protein
MQGHVKTHAERPIGTVTRLDAERGFGFLETKDGREIYFPQNRTAFAMENSLGWRPAPRCSFRKRLGKKARRPAQWDVLDKHALR